MVVAVGNIQSLFETQLQETAIRSRSTKERGNIPHAVFAVLVTYGEIDFFEATKERQLP